MAGLDLGSAFSGIGSAVSFWLPVAFLILMIVMGGAFLIFRQMNKMPYTCFLFSKRNSGVKVYVKKGRFLKGGGQFEIDYGVLDRVKVQAPTDKQTLEGDIVIGFSPSKEEVYWTESFEIDETRLKMDPVSSSAGRVMYANGVQEIYERTTMNDKVILWAMVGAIVVLAFATGLGSYLGGKMVADEYGKGSQAIAEANANIVHLLENATITISRPYVSPGTITPSGVEPSPRNPPPGG